MTERIATATVEGVAVIGVGAFGGPELSSAARAGLAHALDHVTKARALILSLGPIWPGLTAAAAADAEDAPSLMALTSRIEALDIPVVAALHGVVLGAAFDLALAAHYRIADPTARLGFPEVAEGGLPQGGGTQRLPRIIGADRALDVIVGGKILPGEAARKIGLVDDLARADLEAAAHVFTRGLLSEGIGPRPTAKRRDGFADPVEYQSAISDLRATRSAGINPAPERAIDCVEAALLLPFEAGLSLEESLNEDFAHDDTARALRHMAEAERRVVDFPERSEGKPRPLSAIGVVGAGTMGASIAAAVLESGLPVVMVERDQATMTAATKRIHSIFARAVERGRMTERDAALRADMLVPTTALEALGDVDLVVEAVNEPLDRKAKVLAEIAPVLPDGAPIVITSPTADIAALAQAVAVPGAVVGLHFSAPAHLARVAEIAVAPESTADSVATVFGLTRRLSKISVRTSAATGRISGALMAAYIHSADDMVGRGAAPSEVDAAMRAWGVRMGPFQMMDVGGLEQPLLRLIRQPERRPDAESAMACAELIWEEMLARGWTGAAKGRGYLRAKDLSDEPEVLALLREASRAAGVAPKAYRPQDIQRHCLAAMANAGARLLADGVALRPSDIDVVAVHALGLPRGRGGPMMAADLRGLLHLRHDLLEFAHDAPSVFTPAPLLNDLVKNGRQFADLNV